MPRSYKLPFLIYSLFLFLLPLQAKEGGRTHVPAAGVAPTGQANPFQTGDTPHWLEDLWTHYYANDCRWGKITQKYVYSDNTKKEIRSHLEKLSASSKDKLLSLGKILPLYNSTLFHNLLRAGSDEAIDEAYRLWVKFDFYAPSEPEDEQALQTRKMRNIHLAQKAAELLEKGYPIDAKHLMQTFDGISKKLTKKTLTQQWSETGVLESMENRINTKMDPDQYIREEMPGVLDVRISDISLLSNPPECYRPNRNSWIPFKHKVGLARALMQEALGIESPEDCGDNENVVVDSLKQGAKLYSDCFTGLFCFKGSAAEKKASKKASIETPESVEPGIPLDKQKHPVRFTESLKTYLSLRLKDLSAKKLRIEKAEAKALLQAKTKNPNATLAPAKSHACIDKQRDEIEALMAKIRQQRIDEAAEIRRIGVAKKAYDKVLSSDGKKYRVGPDMDPERWEYNPKKNPLDPCLGKGIPLEKCKEDVLRNYLGGADAHELRAYEKELEHGIKSLDTKVEALRKTRKISPFETAKQSTDIKNEKRDCTFEALLDIDPRDWTLNKPAAIYRNFLKPDEKVRRPLNELAQHMSTEQLIDLAYALWHNPTPPGKQITGETALKLKVYEFKNLTPELKEVVKRMEYDSLVREVGQNLQLRFAEGGSKYAGLLPLVKDADACVSKWEKVEEDAIPLSRLENGTLILRSIGKREEADTYALGDGITALKKENGKYVLGLSGIVAGDRIAVAKKDGCAPGVIDWDALKAQKTDIRNNNELDRVLHLMLVDLNLPTEAKFTDSEAWFNWALKSGTSHVHHQHIPNCAAEGLFNNLMSHHEMALSEAPRTKAETSYGTAFGRGMLGQLTEEAARTKAFRTQELEQEKNKLEEMKKFVQHQIGLKAKDEDSNTSKRDLADLNATELRNRAVDRKYEGDPEELAAALRYPPHLLALWRYYREVVNQVEVRNKTLVGKETIGKAAKEQLALLEKMPTERLVDEWQWYDRQSLDGGAITRTEMPYGSRPAVPGGTDYYDNRITPQNTVSLLKPVKLASGEKWQDEKTKGKDPKRAFSIEDSRTKALVDKGAQRLESYNHSTKDPNPTVTGAQNAKGSDSKSTKTEKSDPFTTYIKNVMNATPTRAEMLNQTPMALESKDYKWGSEIKKWESYRKELLISLSKALKGEETMGYRFNPKDPKAQRLVDAIVNCIRSIDMAHAESYGSRDMANGIDYHYRDSKTEARDREDRWRADSAAERGKGEARRQAEAKRYFLDTPAKMAANWAKVDKKLNEELAKIDKKHTERITEIEGRRAKEIQNIETRNKRLHPKTLRVLYGDGGSPSEKLSEYKNILQAEITLSKPHGGGSDPSGAANQNYLPLALKEIAVRDYSVLQAPIRGRYKNVPRNDNPMDEMEQRKNLEDKIGGALTAESYVKIATLSPYVRKMLSARLTAEDDRSTPKLQCPGSPIKISIRSKKDDFYRFKSSYDPDEERALFLDPSPERIINYLYRSPGTLAFYLDILYTQMDPDIFNTSGLDKEQFFQQLCGLTLTTFEKNRELRGYLTQALKNLVSSREGDKTHFKNAEAARMVAFFLQSLDEIGLQSAGPATIQAMGGARRFEPAIVLARMEREQQLLAQVKKQAETDEKAKDRLATLQSTEDFLNKQGMALPALSKILILTETKKPTEGKSKQSYALGVPESGIEGLSHDDLQILNRLADHMTGTKGKAADEVRKSLQPVLLTPNSEVLTRVGIKIAPELQGEMLNQRKEKEIVNPIRESLAKTGLVDAAVDKAVDEAIDPHYKQLETWKDALHYSGPFPPTTWAHVYNLLKDLSPEKTPKGMGNKTQRDLLALKQKVINELQKTNNYVGLDRLAEAEFRRRYESEIAAAGGSQVELERLRAQYLGTIRREVERRYRLDESINIFDTELKRLAESKGKPHLYPPKDWKEVEELLKPEKINGVDHKGFKPSSGLLNLLSGIDHNGGREGLQGERSIVGALATRYLTEKSVKGELANFLAGGPTPKCLIDGINTNGGAPKSEAEIRKMWLSASDPSLDPRPRMGDDADSIPTQNLERKATLFERRARIAAHEYLRTERELNSEIMRIDAEVQILAKIDAKELYPEKRLARVSELRKRKDVLRSQLVQNKQKLLALKEEYDTLKPEFEEVLGIDRARNIHDVLNGIDQREVAWQKRYEGIVVAYTEHCLKPKLRPTQATKYDYTRAMNEGENFDWRESIQNAAMEEFNETQDLLVRGRELAKGIPLPNSSFSKGAQSLTPPQLAEFYLKNHPNRAVLARWLAEAQSRGVDSKLALKLMDQWLRDGEAHQNQVDERVNAAITLVESITVNDPLTGKKVNVGISWTGSGWKVENASLLAGLKSNTALMEAFNSLEKIHSGAQNPIKEIEDQLAETHIDQGLPEHFYMDDKTVGFAYKDKQSSTGYSYGMKPMEEVQKKINEQLATIRQKQFEFLNAHEKMKASADSLLPIRDFSGLDEAEHRAISILKTELAEEIRKLREFGNVPIKDDPQGHQFDQLSANEAADNFALQLGQFQADHLVVLKNVDERWNARYREEAAWLAVEVAAAVATFGVSEGALAASRALRMTVSVAHKLRSAARLHKAGILLNQLTQAGEAVIADAIYSQDAEKYKAMVKEGKTGERLWWGLADKNGDGVYDKYQNGGYIPFHVGNPIEEEKGLYKSFAVFGGAGALDKIGWLDPLIKSESLRGAVAFGLSGATTELVQGNGIEAALKHGVRGTLYGLSLPKIPGIGRAAENLGSAGLVAGNMAYLSGIDAGFYTLDYMTHKEVREQGSYADGLWQDLKGGILMNAWFSKGVPKEVEHMKMEREFRSMLNDAGKEGSPHKSLKAVEDRWVQERLQEKSKELKRPLNNSEKLELQDSLRGRFKQFVSNLSVSDGEQLLKDLAKHNSTPELAHENEKYLGELLRVPPRFAGAALTATKGIFPKNYGSMREYAHSIRKNAAREIAKEFEKGNRGTDAEKTNAKRQLLKDAEIMGLQALDHVDMDKLARNLDLKQSLDGQLYLLISARMGVRTAKLDGSVSPLEQSKYVRFNRYYQTDKPLTPKTRELLYTGAANNPEVLGSQIHNGSLKPREAALIFGRDKVDAALRTSANNPKLSSSPAAQKEIEVYQQGIKDADAVTRFHKDTSWKKPKNITKDWIELTKHLNEVISKRPASLFQMPVNVIDISPQTSKAIVQALAKQTGRSEERVLDSILYQRVIGSESQTIGEVLAESDREPPKATK